MENNRPRECDCNASGLWLDIIVAVDTSSSMTVEGVDFVRISKQLFYVKKYILDQKSIANTI